jgi:hypothetical protein
MVGWKRRREIDIGGPFACEAPSSPAHAGSQSHRQVVKQICGHSLQRSRKRPLRTKQCRARDPLIMRATKAQQTPWIMNVAGQTGRCDRRFENDRFGSLPTHSRSFHGSNSRRVFGLGPDPFRWASSTKPASRTSGTHAICVTPAAQPSSSSLTRCFQYRPGLSRMPFVI